MRRVNKSQTLKTELKGLSSQTLIVLRKQLNNSIAKKGSMKEIRWIFTEYDKIDKINESKIKNEEINRDSIYEYTLLKTKTCEVAETPCLNSKWKELVLDPFSDITEHQSIAFRTKQEYNLSSSILTIHFDLVLQGESSFWIVLRSDKSVESNSSIIQIQKEKYSQRVFAHLGRLEPDKETSEPVFKVFLKQQLIIYSKSINSDFQDEDKVHIEGDLFDAGQSLTIVQIYVNHSKFMNNIIAKHFETRLSKSKIIFGATGIFCSLTQFQVDEKIKNEENYNKYFLSNLGFLESIENSGIDQKTCEKNCCNIF